MGRIRVLGDAVVNRIAAGEVVERPASVVKELLENSLDAGASGVEIELVSGGRRRILVTDDGEGMDRDDALLALERHATSKLDEEGGFERVRTLGFRGEALPSIAAVSRFTLRSAPADGPGTEVEVHGGRIVAVREVGIPRGTTVEVKSLFFNVPARRKFLKSEATELAHVVRLVGGYALAHPRVRMRLRHGERCLIETVPTDSLRDRIRQLHGEGLAERLLPISFHESGVEVDGLAGRPVDGTPRRDGQRLFVNGRVVQDRMLSHAVQQAYGNTMPRDRFPVVFLFVEVDPAEIDVNVHPRKTEVRFTQSARIHDLVREAVAAALGGERAVPALTELRPGGELAGNLGAVPAAALHYLETHRDTRDAGPRTVADPAPARLGRGVSGSRQPYLPEADAGVGALVALAQYRESYIVAEDPQGLVLVDQHAAHERVLFERYLAQAEAGGVEVQRLLFPVTLELAPQERILLESEHEEFRRLGFLLEPFGGGAYKIEGLPAIVRDLEPGPLVRELVGEAGRARSASADLGRLRRKLVTSAACQAAIKIHHPLGLAAMQALLDDLGHARNPTTCPHGRPVLFRLGLEEIERGFRRR